ncbi:hypothetical protein RJ640_025198, partial [Escallonia rubra]
RILHSRTLIKHIINADDVDEVSIVDNATIAAAIVLQHVGWAFTEGLFQKGDAVIVLHYAFQAVKKSIEAYVSLSFSCRSLLVRLKKSSSLLKKAWRVRLAIIDHITSMPCVVLPVRELVRICREKGVDQVFVDVAHAIESAWIGTHDYSSQLVVPEVLDFIDRFEGGIEGIMKRNHDAVVQMAEMLAKAWGTDLGSPPDMCPSMAMVGLPASLGISRDTDASKLRTHLRDHFGVEVPLHYQAPKENEVEAENGDKDSLITGYARISHPSLQHS